MDVVITILECIYWALQIILAFFLIQPFILLLIFSGKKIFTGRPEAEKPSLINKNYQFGIVITAHRETAFLPPIVDSLIKQEYPHFNVYIVADDCDTSLLRFEDPRIHILSPPTPLNSKSKAINYALDRFDAREDVLVIFDPDNLVHPLYLTTLNAWYNKGYLAVQGSLHAKNIAGKYEKIDGLGVLFNNFIDRDMRSVLGVSVNIWGCGISVNRRIYQKIIYDERSRTGGFDKHMQIEIARHVPRIAYAEDAILFDEKVTSGSSLEKQRTRWILAWFKFLGAAFGLLFQGIQRLDGNLVYFGFNLIKPPYFLQVLAALLFVRLNWTSHRETAFAWLIVLLVFIISFIAIIIISATGRTLYRGIWFMPLLIYHQINSLFKLRMGKRSFLKTEHSKIVYIDDLLKHAPNS